MSFKNVLFTVLFFAGILNAGNLSIIDKTITNGVKEVLPMQKFVDADKSYFHKTGTLPSDSSTEKIKFKIYSPSRVSLMDVTGRFKILYEGRYPYYIRFDLIENGNMMANQVFECGFLKGQKIEVPETLPSDRGSYTTEPVILTCSDGTKHGFYWEVKRGDGKTVVSLQEKIFGNPFGKKMPEIVYIFDGEEQDATLDEVRIFILLQYYDFRVMD